jgi:ABC-type glutathione transport system ATPase component
VQLGPRARARPSTLSGGETARANLAVALAGNPQLLLADEPTAEVSTTEERALLRLLTNLQADDRAILLVTHSLNMVERFCDDAVWIDAGTKHAEGDPKRVVGAYLSFVEESEERLLADTTARAVASANVAQDFSPVLHGQRASQMCRTRVFTDEQN